MHYAQSFTQFHCLFEQESVVFKINDIVCKSGPSKYKFYTKLLYYNYAQNFEPFVDFVQYTKNLVYNLKALFYFLHLSSTELIGQFLKRRNNGKKTN